MTQTKKSGMAVIVGRSNVGKSTLINSLVNQKVAIVTPKPQTTRHVIQGVVNEPEGQIVFVDTPGFFLQTKDVLSKKLLDRIHFALKDVDAIIYLLDPTRTIGEEERRLAALIKASNVPVLCVINKTDLSKKQIPYIPDYYEFCEGIGNVIEISALKAKHLKLLLEELFKLMPQGEPLYPQEGPGRDDTFWVSEIIREKLFHTMGDEIPYGIHVKIENIEDKGSLISIEATIITDTERHKGMIIGKSGKKLKEMGMSARKEIELAADKKVYLDLSVKYDPKWMDRYE